MTIDTQNSRAAADRRAAAIVASAAIAIGFVIYWSLEIQAVREMLELAYG